MPTHSAAAARRGGEAAGMQPDAARSAQLRSPGAMPGLAPRLRTEPSSDA